MILLAPEWLFLLPILAVLGWKFPKWSFHAPVRVLALLVFVLTLAHPVVNRGSSQLDLWVMIDQSASANGIPEASSREIQSILEHSAKSGDRIRLVDFAGEAVLRGQGDPEFSSMMPGTRMEDALSYVMGQMDPQRVNRILMVTDGYSTQPLDAIDTKLQRNNIVVDYRLASPDFAQDVHLSKLQKPTRVHPGEPILLSFDVEGPVNQTSPIPWSVSREGLPSLSGHVLLKNGKATVRLSDRCASPRSLKYQISLQPSGDPVVQNNSAQFYVEVTGGRSILLISPYDQDPMIPFLKAQGFDIRHIQDPRVLTVHDLTNAALVILNNTPASKIPTDFLQSLNFFVKQQGGGLLLCGGTNSFGAGGYFSSPIDELLPVSMEQKNDQIKIMTAMSIVLDRSGSMAMSAGVEGKTKMDLANSGVIQAVSFLGNRDYLSVHAVDSSAHSIVSMCNVGENRDKILEVVPQIRSMGGGIFIDEALDAGYRQLLKTDVGIRHMLLFADAADSENPGNYKETLAAMQKDHITVSVIAMGTPEDQDAQLLRDIASLGRGRIFFCNTPSEIPHIFVQETITAIRSVFVREAVPTQATPGWQLVSPTRLAWPDIVDGYNLCFLRDQATSPCVSRDSNKAPLVSYWSCGNGKSAAIAFPMGGTNVPNILAWPQYGDFVQTLARWLVRPESPEGFAVRASTQGEHLNVELYYSDQAVMDIAKQQPELVLESSAPNRKPKIVHGTWEHIQPGIFRSSFLMPAGTSWRGVVRIANKVIPFGPVGADIDPEWELNPQARTNFEAMCRTTGGKERVDLSSIFQEPRSYAVWDLQQTCIVVFLLLFLIDAALTRLGIDLIPRRKKSPPTT